VEGERRTRVALAAEQTIVVAVVDVVVVTLPALSTSDLWREGENDKCPGGGRARTLARAGLLFRNDSQLCNEDDVGDPMGVARGGDSGPVGRVVRLKLNYVRQVLDVINEPE